MTTRGLRPSDVPILQAMAARAGFPYPDPSKLVEICVVVDDDDRPIMAVGAEALVQLYLWVGDIERPHAKLHALRLLHQDMAERLKRRGYNGAEAFLPPAIAARFARRLEKTFGWLRNWPSWTRSI